MPAYLSRLAIVPTPAPARAVFLSHAQQILASLDAGRAQMQLEGFQFANEMVSAAMVCSPAPAWHSKALGLRAVIRARRTIVCHFFRALGVPTHLACKATRDASSHAHGRRPGSAAELAVTISVSPDRITFRSLLQTLRKGIIDDPIVSQYMHFLDVDEMIPAEFRTSSRLQHNKYVDQVSISCPWLSSGHKSATWLPVACLFFVLCLGAQTHDGCLVSVCFCFVRANRKLRFTQAPAQRAGHSWAFFTS